MEAERAEGRCRFGLARRVEEPSLSVQGFGRALVAVEGAVMGEAREVAEAYYAALEKGDVDRTAALVAPDVDWMTPTGPVPPDQVRGFLQGNITAFPDARFEVQTVIESGDRVVLEGDYVGTNSGR